MTEAYKRNAKIAVLFTIFLNMLGYGILIPILPMLLTNASSEFYILGAGVSHDHALLVYGFALSVFPLGMFFASPILGQLSDSLGRKKMLAFSIFGTALSNILIVVAIVLRSPGLLIFSRLFDGVTGGNVTIAQAVIADITEPEHRTRNFGLMGAAFGFGFIVGPFLGGVLSDPSIVPWFGATTPFIFSAILTLINAIQVVVLLPETHHQRSLRQKIDIVRSIKNVWKGFQLPRLKHVFFTVFLYNTGFNFFTAFFSVFLISQFHYDQSQIGTFFGFIGLMIMITQAVITRAVAKRFREVPVLLISQFVTALGIISMATAGSSSLLYLAVVPFAIANGLSQANLTGLLSRLAPDGRQGEVLGINGSMQAFAQIFPSAIAGAIAAATSPVIPLYIAAFVMVVASTYFFAMRRELHLEA